MLLRRAWTSCVSCLAEGAVAWREPFGERQRQILRRFRRRPPRSAPDHARRRRAATEAALLRPLWRTPVRRRRHSHRTKRRTRANRTGASQPSRSRTLRVEMQTLDTLLNLAGEIAISRDHLTAALERLGAAGAEALELHRDADRLYAELQEAVVRARMVPSGPTFRQHVRTVRDLAEGRGKSARLVDRGRRRGGRRHDDRVSARAADAHDPQRARPRHRAAASPRWRRARTRGHDRGYRAPARPVRSSSR